MDSAIENNSPGLTPPLALIAGCLLGTAAGDAIGLPYEGMSPRRIGKLLHGPLRHRLLFGRGMISDDTEHSCLVAQALISSGGEPDVFRRALGWRLRWWFLALPAGIGLGTLRAILKLWLGFSPKRSGIRTAGNGPMMRSAILGVVAGDAPDRLRELVRINTRVTHTDPRAERAAWIVAWAAGCNARQEMIAPADLRVHLQAMLNEDDELASLVDEAIESAERDENAPEFCRRSGMGKGVSGYCYTTLKVVLQLWLRHPQGFEQAITEAVVCGGDTDTVAAILGGIIGAGCGVEGIPKPWLDDLLEWPRSRAWIERLARQLADTQITGAPQRPPRVLFPLALIRNLLFMGLVLAHGFRRLLPPY